MKPVHFIPPALAVIAVSFWLSRSWGGLQATNELLLIQQQAGSHDVLRVRLRHPNQK
jgi:hypothetical protein